MSANNKGQNVANAPLLRFPEFDGEWSMSSLGECCGDFEYGMNAPAKKFDGINKYIRITDIDDETNRYDDNNPVSPDGNLDNKYIVKKNDILFARTGASTGKTYLYNPNDGKLYFAGFLIRANVKDCNDARFVFQLTQTSKFKKWINVVSMRSGQPGINSQEYASFSFEKPQIQEQKKIAEFLSLLDKRIETQRSAIEKLKSLMAGICSKILLENTPNTRIKDCLSYESSTLKESDLKYQGLYPVYGANGLCGFTDSAECSDESILIVKDGSGVGSLQYVTGDYSFIGTLNCLKFKPGFCLKYIYFMLSAFDFSKFKTGMAIPHIYFKDYGNSMIYCPPFDKQQEIAEKNSKLETKIKRESDLLSLYQNQKQYLLSKMFI